MQNLEVEKNTYKGTLIKNSFSHFTDPAFIVTAHKVGIEIVGRNSSNDVLSRGGRSSNGPVGSLGATKPLDIVSRVDNTVAAKLNSDVQCHVTNSSTQVNLDGSLGSLTSSPHTPEGVCGG